MIVVALVSVAIVAGAPWSLVGIGVAVGVVPGPATALLAAAAVVIAFRRRSAVPDAASEAALFRSLAGSVSTGSTLRAAIQTAQHPAVSPTVTRLCSVGAPMGSIGAELAESLPVSGRSFSALCAMSELSGSSIAPALGGFADRASTTEDHRRSRRVSLAQARMSAWVVGVAPLVLTAVVVGMRGVPASGTGIVVISMVAGAAMQVAGMLVVFSVSGKATW